MKCTSRECMSAVSLSGGVGKVGRHVHHETDDWFLTSDHPIEYVHDCPDAEVYDEPLPGRLGMFVYPRDVRFHMRNKTRTTRTDFDAIVRSERTLLSLEQTLNTQNITVAQETYDADAGFVPNEDGIEEQESEEEEEDDDEEDEVEGGQHMDDDCMESDEDQDA